MGRGLFSGLDVNLPSGSFRRASSSFSAEPMGIEPASETTLSCENTGFQNAKLRQMMLKELRMQRKGWRQDAKVAETPGISRDAPKHLWLKARRQKIRTNRTVKDDSGTAGKVPSLIPRASQ